MAEKQPSYCIGVDTGGTYTDAVLIDSATRAVVATAKRPTTHYDLHQGMGAAIGAVLEHGEHPIAPESILRVAVSTTLATNAVVEGAGHTRVGLLIVGWGNRVDIAGASVVQHVAGGHRIDGSEQEPLALEAVIDAIASMRDRVDVYAVCSLMSFVNPAHEQMVAKAISMIDPKPVFCSHTVSKTAGMRERAATAVLNARLLPVMAHFLSGVRKALDSLRITADVVVVRGDATTMPIEDALRCAASTIASGPAATALFGTRSALQDALVVDVGGTTTDVTLLAHGRPVLAEEGLSIASWVTHVQAVEMFTVGVGGDSHVKITKDGFSIGPRRVTPLALAGSVPDMSAWLCASDYGSCLMAVAVDDAPLAGSDDVTHSASRYPRALEYDVERVLALLHEHGAMSHLAVSRALGLPAITLERVVDVLTQRQRILEVGFTPTDALHALGLLTFGTCTVAQEAVALFADSLHCTTAEVLDRVLRTTRQRIEDALVEYVARREVGGNFAGYLSQRHKQSLLQVRVALSVPIIGIGAAARHLLPQVGAALQSTVYFPEQYEVGNALGAALLGADSLC